VKLGIPTLANYDGLDAMCLSAEQGKVKPSGYIVVDNGGTYDGAAKHHVWMEQASARGASIELYTPGYNLGVAASWNWMLERAFGMGESALVIANDDVSFGEQTFAELVLGLDSLPFVSADGWACFGQTASCTTRVGWYDENFWPAYYEDNDYEMRLRRAGISPVRVVSQPLQHVGWATTRRLGDPAWLREGRERNRQYFQRKWSPDGTSWPTQSHACTEPFRGSPPSGWEERRRAAHQPMRWDILNHIAERIGAKRYLEIGVSDGTCMRHVNVAQKWGVDPSPLPGAVTSADIFVPHTSDWFFETIGKRAGPFDLVFIDGLHHAEQVYRDVQGALGVLSEGGVICLHDCNPHTEDMQRVPSVQSEWTGDCWKAVARLRAEGEHAVRVVNADYGVGIVLPGGPHPEARPITLGRGWQELSWADLVDRRDELLGLLDPATWPQWLEGAR
jgi:GT2 family glycosyltransferase